MRSAKHGCVLLLVAVLIAGCDSPQAMPSPSSSEVAHTPGASTEAAILAPNQTPVPTAAPTVADPFVGQLVVTVSDHVRVRSAPKVSEDSVKYKPLLPSGTELTVIGGPVSASGYTWYQVDPVSFEVEGPGFGWVAMADKDSEPWICPLHADVVALATFGPSLGLACYGDQEVILTARVGPFDGLACPDDPGFGWWVEPLWLGPCRFDVFLTSLEGDLSYDFMAKLDPEPDRGTLPTFFDGVGNPIWTPVEVSGRYDHPDAIACRGYGEEPPGHKAVVDECRRQFVVSSIMELDKLQSQHAGEPITFSTFGRLT